MLIIDEDLDRVFIMEIKKMVTNLHFLKNVAKINCIVGVDCSRKGRSHARGLELLWEDSLKVDVASFSLNLTQKIIQKILSLLEFLWLSRKQLEA